MCEWTGWSVPSRRDGGVCGLSDVLEPMSPSLRKYFLSPTALRGILRRADANGEPSPELVAEFQRTFDTFGAIMAEYAHTKPPKPKSAKQVADWLKKISDPETCPDSPRYKGCGNGMATNQPRWIFTRMLSMEGIEW
jgi:hypothetical protein